MWAMARHGVSVLRKSRCKGGRHNSHVWAQECVLVLVSVGVVARQGCVAAITVETQVITVETPPIIHVCGHVGPTMGVCARVWGSGGLARVCCGHDQTSICLCERDKVPACLDQP